MACPSLEPERQPTSTDSTPITFSPGRDASADAIPDDRTQDEDDALARQQLEFQLLASAAATLLPASRLSSASSSSSTPSPSPRTSSHSNWSAHVGEAEHDIEEDGNGDLSSRGSRITIGRHWRLTLTLIFSIMTAVAYFVTRSPISQGFSDEILIRFQRPIENGCGWAERRLIYLSQLDPTLANNTPCVPTLCPATLSFLHHPNPYAVLGLPSPSYARAPPSKRDIQRAYRTLAMLYHPDKSASYLSPNIATHIMAIYTGAMEILLDAEMRESFDEQWKRGWGSRDFKKWQRAQEMEKLGEVNTWTVLKETRVGDLRKIRFGGL